MNVIKMDKYIKPLFHSFQFVLFVDKSIKSNNVINANNLM
jgi:hypothetical protein